MGVFFHALWMLNEELRYSLFVQYLIESKTSITSMLFMEDNVKYVQVVVEDAWLIRLKRKCLDEGVTLAQKLLSLIGREIGEAPWTQGK